MTTVLQPVEGECGAAKGVGIVIERKQPFRDVQPEIRIDTNDVRVEGGMMELR